MNSKDADFFFNLIKNLIKTGEYDKTPVGIANLTLKIGAVVDAKPDANVVTQALDMLGDLIDQVPRSDLVLSVHDAILHKIGYLLNAYRYLIDDETFFYKSKFLADSKKVIMDILRSYSPDLELPVLRRVYDADGMGHYEESVLTISEILDNNGIPPIRLQEQTTWGTPPPPPGSRNKNNDNPPPRAKQDPNDTTPPKTATAGAPVPPDESDTKPNIEITPLTKQLDVTRLILSALLYEVTGKTEKTSDGVKIFVKPDVLNRVFMSHSVCNVFKKDLGKDKIRVDHSVIEVDYNNDPFARLYLLNYDKATADTIVAHVRERYDKYNPREPSWWGAHRLHFNHGTGIEYVCQILEKLGFPPQMGNDGSIIVRGTPEHINDLLKMTNMAHLYRDWLAISPDEREALKYVKINIDDKLTTNNITQGLDNKYTADSVYRIWNNISLYPNYYANNNRGSFGQ